MCHLWYEQSNAEAPLKFIRSKETSKRLKQEDPETLDYIKTNKGKKSQCE